MKERKVGRKWCLWLFGWGWKRGEILVGPTSFLSYPTKTFSSQIGDTIGEKSVQKYLDKIAYISFLIFWLTGHKYVVCLFFFLDELAWYTYTIHCPPFFWLSFFFSFFTRHEFYFLINLGDFFFGWLFAFAFVF